MKTLLKMRYGPVTVNYGLVGSLKSSLLKVINALLPEPSVVLEPIFEDSDQIVFRFSALYTAEQITVIRRIKVPKMFIRPRTLNFGDQLHTSVQLVLQKEQQTTKCRP